MRSTEGGFSPEVYLEAAQERLAEANLLLDAQPPQYVMASYLAGVAVECLFFAYSMRAGVANTAKHHLALHALRSDFYIGMTNKERERITEYVETVTARWQNNHRYRSYRAFRNFCIKNKLFIVDGAKTTRLGVVEHNAKILVDAAEQIIHTGVRRWTI